MTHSKALVERVARVLYERNPACAWIPGAEPSPLPWEQLSPEDRSPRLDDARAALTASGLDEAREALEPFALIAREHALADHADTYAPRPSRGRPNMADYRRARHAADKLRGE